MERKINILLGVLGAFILTSLPRIHNSLALNAFSGCVTNVIIDIISFIGMLLLICFSLLLVMGVKK